MGISDKLVLNRQRHLKWRALDRLEMILMIICGLTLFGFSVSVSLDILTRTLGYPWLWLQEVTSTLFIYGIFVGAAVATRRNDHLYLTAFSDALHGTPRLVVEIIIRGTILTVAACLVYSVTSTTCGASGASDCRPEHRLRRFTRPFLCPARSLRCSPSNNWSTVAATASTILSH